MARPTKPLIKREVVLDIALEIIDQEGIDALSIRRLAAEVGVNGASLYHHFESKDEILVGTTELALARTPITMADRSDWRRMVLSGVFQLVDLLVAHPGLAPIIVRRSSMGTSARVLDSVSFRLIEAGVPIEAVGPIFDALERLALGWAIRAQTAPWDTSVERRDLPSLSAVAAAKQPSSREVLEMAALGIMDAIATGAAPATRRNGRTSAKTSAAKKATPGTAKRTTAPRAVKKAPAKAAARKTP